MIFGFLQFSIKYKYHGCMQGGFKGHHPYTPPPLARQKMKLLIAQNLSYFHILIVFGISTFEKSTPKFRSDTLTRFNTLLRTPCISPTGILLLVCLTVHSPDTHFILQHGGLLSVQYTNTPAASVLHILLVYRCFGVCDTRYHSVYFILK